jgi:glycosyltransferase involved in cell wall biosynthesis
MKIGLFDLYTSDHHLPYASRIKRSLENVSDHEISFITLSETSRCVDLLDLTDITYLDTPDSPPIEDRPESFIDVVDSALEKFFSQGNADQYDVIHFLYADDILGPLWHHSSGIEDTFLVGELNGVFFHRGTVLRQEYLHELFLWTLRSPVGGLLDSVIPERTAHEALWQDLHLYRCLDTGTFDRTVVHSREAERYLSRLSTQRTSRVTKIPYPSPTRFGHDISKNDARSRLGFSQNDSILLFFGGMKNEKGIDLLLEALRRYNGPKFTMHLAGPLTDVTKEALDRLDQASAAEIVYELGFIDTPELYHRAADAVLMPYRNQYGKERASQLFEEVCGATRPIIVSDFGVLGRLTKEWNLGITFTQGSARSLAAALRTFARDSIPFSKDRMREYSNQHSYDQAAIELSAVYSGD